MGWTMVPTWIVLSVIALVFFLGVAVGMYVDNLIK